MARSCLIEKEKKKSILCYKYNSKIKNLKRIIKNKNSDRKDVFEANLQLQKIPRNAHFVRKRNRCFITGRSRGFFRRFGLSRNLIRELAFKGDIPGMVKSSW